MRHRQRSNTRFGYRPEWTHDWSGQFYESPLEPLGDLWLQDGGGWERFSPLDEEGKLFQGRIFNVGRLVRTPSTNLTWQFPDGTQRNYTAFTGTNVAWGRTFYLTDDLAEAHRHLHTPGGKPLFPGGEALKMGPLSSG